MVEARLGPVPSGGLATGCEALRVLVLDRSTESAWLEREFGRSHEVRRAEAWPEVLRWLDGEGWSPDVAVLSLDRAERDGAALIAELRERIGEVPLVLTAGGRDAVQRQIEALAVPPGGGRRDGLLRQVLLENRALNQTIATNRSELLAEIDVVARRAAEQAVQRAVERLMGRLGLDDDEGVRTAIRLARAYEEARSRFWQAITTGLASGLLVALAWGIWTMLGRDLDPRR